MHATVAASAASGPLLHDLRVRRAIAVVRIVFGAVWAADAVLKWLPGFVGGTFMSTLRDARAGQPADVKAWIDVFVATFRADPTAWAYALAVVETLLAVCLIAGAFTNVVCVFGAWLSLGIWTTAEGFGGPYQNGSTDVSASIIYVLVFALLFATAAGGVWGVDAALRRRLGRFGRLCSRAPARAAVVMTAAATDVEWADEVAQLAEVLAPASSPSDVPGFGHDRRHAEEGMPRHGASVPASESPTRSDEREQPAQPAQPAQ